MNSVSFSPSLSPVSSKSSIKSFLQQARDCMHAFDFEGAIQNLSLGILKSENIEEIYDILLELLPEYSHDQFKILIGNLPSLLAASSHLAEQQGKLALKLAEWNISYAQTHLEKNSLSYYLDAIDYYAVAIKIAEKQGNQELAHANHVLASRLLMRVFSLCFIKRLDDNKGNPKKFGQLISSISKFEKYCCVEEDRQLIQGLYNYASSILIKISPDSQGHYKDCLPFIEKGAQEFVLSHITMTEIYSQRLASWRTCFGEFLLQKDTNPQNVRDFQKSIVYKLREIFQLFLEDVMAFSPPPPCDFSMRALGSIGREEPCLFSDLESMILIENDEHKIYFQKLTQLLEFQVVSLGETNSGTHPVFTCLGFKHASGFHFDPGGNPVSHSDLIRTPKKMAVLQLQPIETDPEDVPIALPNQVLKSASLLGNDQEKLFFKYQKLIEEILEMEVKAPDSKGVNMLRHARALQLFKTRMLDFKTAWLTSEIPNPIHIKKDYVELINFFLADLALYYGVQETNTLDIIEALVGKDVFSQSSGELLKEAVSFIYCLRLRLHQFYGEQKEEGYLENLSGYQLKNHEIEQLKKIYWLVLRPLYHCCLSKILDENKSVEEAFFRIDFIEQSLQEICNSQERYEFFIPVIKFIATHLIKIQKPIETHLNVYSKLSRRSNLEILRSAYLKLLTEENFPKNELEIVRSVPNPTGFRLSFLAKENQLKEKIEAISSFDFHHDKYTSQVRLIFSGGTRYLKPEIVRAIIDESGDLKDEYPGSAHRVSRTAGLHFKQKPTHPLMEYAIHNLFFRLCGDLTPSTELVRFEVDGEKMYPVLISETIIGDTLKQKLENPLNLEKAQWARWTWMLLCSVLVRPGDGRRSNYILNQNKEIFCVDNDISFVDPFVKGALTSQVNFCSALFCLFQDRPLERNVLEEFCELDPDAILTAWMEDVIKKESAYVKLFTEVERKSLYEEDPENRFKATILFREGALATLNMQFVYLQNQLASLLNQGKDLYPVDLLKHIISLSDQLSLNLSPGYHLAKCYANANPSSVEDKLKWITSRTHDQSLSSLKSDQACLGRVPTIEEVERKKLFSPTKAREELFMSLLHRNPDFLSVGVVRGKETLFSSFKGIKKNEAPDRERQMIVLQALICLIQLKAQKPVSLALQHCEVLTTKNLEPFLHNDLEYLDLRYCTQIKNGDIELIQNRCPKLKELYLSGCSGLTTLQVGTLFSAPLMFLKLQVMHLEGCPNLKVIRLRTPLLRKINANHNPELRVVSIQSIAITESSFIKCSKISEEAIDKQIRFINIEDLDVLGLHLNDRQELLVAALKKSPEVSKFLFQKHRSGYRSACLDILSRNGLMLEFMGLELQNDFDVVHRAVCQNGLALKYANVKHENYLFFSLQAVIQNENAIQFVSEELKDSFGFMVQIVVRKGHLLEFASSSLRNRAEVAVSAIRQTAFAYEFISDELKKDRDFLLSAVEANRKVLRVIRSEFLKDREFILSVVKKDGKALKYVPEEFKNDETIIKAAVRQNANALKYASEGLKRKREFVSYLVKKNWRTLKYVSEEFKADENIVLNAVIKDAQAFKFACEDLRSNRDFVIAVSVLSMHALKYACKDFRDDKQIVLAAVKQFGGELKYASERLRDDEEIVLAAVQRYGFSLTYASERLKNDREIVLAAIKNHEFAAGSASEELKNDREIMLEAMRSNMHLFKYAGSNLMQDRAFILEAKRQNQSDFDLVCVNSELWLDRVFVLELVKLQGNALQYLSEEFRNDREIVFAALNHDGFAIQYVGDELILDREILLTAVRKNGWVLQLFSENLRNDREIILASLESGVSGFGFAGEILRADKEIVFDIVQRDGSVLHCVSEALKNDREVVLAAVKSKGCSLEHASQALSQDRELVLVALNQNASALKYASKDLLNDREIVLAAVKINGMTLEHASEELKRDREIVLAAIEQDGAALEYAADMLKRDKIIVLTAVRKRGYTLKYACEELKNDKEVVLVAVHDDLRALEYASKKLKNDRDVVLASVQLCGESLKYASDELKNDYEIVLAAVSESGLALKYASEAFKNNREIVTIAVQENDNALEYAGETLRRDSEIWLAAGRM